MNTLTVFVKNRVDEINSIILKAVLSYILVKDNPGHLLTRGEKAEAVLGNHFWWKGPLWLKHSSLPLDRAREASYKYKEGMNASWPATKSLY